MPNLNLQPPPEQIPPDEMPMEPAVAVAQRVEHYEQQYEQPEPQPQPQMQPGRNATPAGLQDEYFDQAPPVSAPKMQHSPVRGSPPPPPQPVAPAAAGPSDLPPGADGGAATGQDDPEPLSAEGNKDATNNGLFDVLDDHTIACLYSKVWALRELACDKMCSEG